MTLVAIAAVSAIAVRLRTLKSSTVSAAAIDAAPHDGEVAALAAARTRGSCARAGAAVLATAARFGRALTEEGAVGRILAHYYDIGGRFIEPRNDIAVQISLPRLRAAKNVVALCADYLTPESLLGALRTGIITHLVLPDTLADQEVQMAYPR